MTLAQTEPKSIKIGSTPIKRVTIRPNGAEKQIRPVWQPGVNTLAYYPLTSTSTVNDMSGNGLTLTNNGNTVFGTYDGVDCGYFGGNASLRQLSLTTQYIGQTFTLVAWMRAIDTECVVGTYNNQGTSRAIGIMVQNNNDRVQGSIGRGSSFLDVTYNTTINNTWYLVGLTHNSNGDLKLYLNGVQVQTGNGTVNEGASNFAIGASVFKESEIYYSNGYISNVILEDKERTAQEISDYYNQTKGNYGL